MENTIDYTELLEEIHSELNYITTTIEIESGERALQRENIEKVSNFGLDLFSLLVALYITSLLIKFLFRT